MSIKTNTTSLENILNKINSLPEAGIDLPQLTNEGASSHLLSGKELIDQEGNIVTGSMPNNGAINMKFDGINQTGVIITGGYTSGGIVSLDNTISNEVSTQEGLIQQIKNTANSLPDAGAGGPSGVRTVIIDNQLGYELYINGVSCPTNTVTNNIPIINDEFWFMVFADDSSVLFELLVDPIVEDDGLSAIPSFNTYIDPPAEDGDDCVYPIYGCTAKYGVGYSMACGHVSIYPNTATITFWDNRGGQ